MAMLTQLAAPFRANLESAVQRSDSFAEAFITTTLSEIRTSGEFLAVLCTATVLDKSVTKFVETMTADCE